MTEDEEEEENIIYLSNLPSNCGSDSIGGEVDTSTLAQHISSFTFLNSQ